MPRKSMGGVKPNKQYRNYELKDKVLKSIFDGHITVSDIFNHIQYKGKVNYLTIELRGLYETGCIGRKWISGEYQYHLLEKGRTLIHNGADYYARFRRQQIGNIIKNEVESTLANNEKFANAVQMYAQSHFSNPIIVPPQRPEVDPEGLNRGGTGQPINIQLPAQSPESITLPQRTINTRYGTIPKPVDAVFNVIKQYSDDLKSKETELATKEDELAAVKEELAGIKMQAYVQSIPQPTKCFDKKSGDVLTPAEMQIVQSKAQQRDNQYKINADRRIALVKKYKGYLLDNNFFKEWGVVWPYWIKHFGLFKAGSIEILSTGNAEIKREHVKGKLTDRDIGVAKFYIHQLAKDGVLIFGIGMRTIQLIKY